MFCFKHSVQCQHRQCLELLLTGNIVTNVICSTAKEQG